MSSDVEKIAVSKIFNDVTYVIPIYQRNYAWSEKQIEQLIEDIESSKGEYFLGNLIVDKKEQNVYELIDGQQRLTTLYILKMYLGIDVINGHLKFEARDKSNKTLERIKNNKLDFDEMDSQEIVNGYNIIKSYFKAHGILKEEFNKKLENIFLIRVQVPKNIDLNHYFEVMNTRGEQLELHEIVKAKLLETLNSDEEKNIASMIWEKCSDMNSYVQMNFNVDARKQLFTSNWSSLKSDITDFDSIELTEKTSILEKKSLSDILNDNELSKTKSKQVENENENENERFESPISFPNFLLQVNATINKVNDDDSSLDDRNFMKNLKPNWSSTENAKNFLFNLLKCRVIFDKYILKREFARDYKDTGKWSLQKLKKYSDGKGDKAKYVATLTEVDNKKLRTLQSCLRITYTSPKTMHWITLVLSSVLEKNLENKEVDIIEILENYCIGKVNESKYEDKSGFGFERIVFTYLDYLLYRDGYSYNGEQIISELQDDWQFQFRNSIEHFYPQNPAEVSKWREKDINGFGNLALLTVSGNSKFSNLPPSSKLSTYQSVINQSLKLKIISSMMYNNDNIWTEIMAEQHKVEMFGVLEKEWNEKHKKTKK